MNDDDFDRGRVNYFLFGFSGFEKDPRTSKYELEAKIKRVVMAGKYKVNGKVLVLPIQGKGRSNLTLGN